VEFEELAVANALVLSTQTRHNCSRCSLLSTVMATATSPPPIFLEFTVIMAKFALDFLGVAT
jgi:hypothetical protein